MRFIRENIFLLSAAVAVILIGGIMLASSASIGRDVDKALSKRQELSDQLERFGEEPVNETMVEEERQRVEAARATLRAVVDWSIAWNCRNCQPLPLIVKTEDGERKVPAFPIDRELYSLYDLTFNAALVYHREMADLLKGLRPVVPPTQEQIDKEKAVWEKRLQNQWQREDAERRRAAEAAEGDIADDGIADDGNEPPEIRGEGPPTPQKILDMANNALLVRHAQKGLIYASSEALDIVLPRRPRVPPPITQIWLAQLNYWITKDIIAAISATNEVSARLAESRSETPSVLNAAVKELVKIEIDEKYVAGGEVPGRPTLGGRRPTATPGVVNSFTQRGSCQQYDVLRYKFTTVMPTRFLNALEQNLMNRNYHTILGVQITELSEIPADRYYGTDPVMTVTLQGELLLLTAWIRGTEHDCKISERDVIGDGKNPWRDFLKKLSRQGKQAKPSPGKHIWSLLSLGLKQSIAKSSSASATREKAIREINGLLAGKEFYDKASWQNVVLGSWEGALLVKLNKKTIQSANIPRLNRALLKAAFPNEIAKSPYRPPLMPAEVDPTEPPGP